MGKSPATLAYTAEFCDAMRKMVAGDTVQYADCPEPVYMDWVAGHPMPVWFAAYGPRALKKAGEVGDGLIIQLADVGLCEWFGGQAKAAGEGRGPRHGGLPGALGGARLGRRQGGRRRADQVVPGAGGQPCGRYRGEIRRRHRPRGPTASPPISRRARGAGAGGAGYNYRQHADKVSDNTYYITPEITDSFCILGEPDEHVAKLKALEKAGVTQFTIYLTNGAEERIVADYGDHVIPNFPLRGGYSPAAPSARCSLRVRALHDAIMTRAACAVHRTMVWVLRRGVCWLRA